MSTQELFDKFIATEYKTVRNKKKDPDFLKDITELFDKLKSDNQYLTTRQINQYVYKFDQTKKAINFYFVNGVPECLFEPLTSRHLLDQQCVSKILACLTYVRSPVYINWKWTRNLKNLGYIFTTSQTDIMKALLNYDHINDIDDTDNIDNIDNSIKHMNNLHILCDKIKFSDANAFDEINTFCSKYKLTCDNKCLAALLSENQCGKYTEKIFNLLCNNKFVPNSETIMCVINYVNNINIMLECIDKLITDKSKFTMIHFDKIYKNITGSHTYISVINFAIKHNILPTEKHIMAVKYIYYGDGDNDNDYDHRSVDDNDDYTPDKIDNITPFYEFFFDKVKIIPSTDLCDYVCKCKYVKLFNVLIKRNLFLLTDKSLLLACQNPNVHIIENLVNMKADVTMQCVINLPWYENRIKHRNFQYGRNKPIKLEDKYLVAVEEKILNILISGGLILDSKVIEILYKKECYLNQEQYNIEDNEDLYFMVHKNTLLSGIKKLTNHYANKTHKKYLKLNTLDLEELKCYIKKNKFKPNQFYYDNIVLNDDIRQWLDVTYDMKPTLITLHRIDDFIDRDRIMDIYFNDATKYHPLIDSNKKYYV
jgi:hypothetical protein